MTKVALVTGGSRGLGKALTRSLLERGWTVVIDGREEDALRDTFEELANPALRPIEGDVSEGRHRRRLAAEIESLGRLDLLVNNASFLGPSPQPRLDQYPPEIFRQVIEVNVVAPLAILQEFLPLLRRSHGVVINVTSDAAVEGYEGWGGYGSSKAALEQITRVLAAEEPGINVYWVDPGDMNTRMQQEAFPGEDVSDRPPPEASVPGLLHLIEVRPASGRYQARQIA
ncbi:MAG TPA: SDR family oxidoreductase [Acidimicrobiia bacterium]|nr:SDR family oxidoreductase [Acidimicrobiia bacterium]